MNVPVENDVDDGELIPADDWPTFYTMVPVWILLAGCSAQAYKMYAFLAEHINNRKPGRRIACPKQAAIARLLGLSNDRQVAPYRRELEELGAIAVEKYRYDGGMRQGYRYVVRFNPPAGFGGLRSLQEFYADNTDVETAKREGRTRTALAAPAEPEPSGADPAPDAGSADKPTAAPTARKKGKRGRGDVPPQRAEVAAVLDSFPAELRAAMRETAHTDSPKTLVAAVDKALAGRSAQQLAARVLRRWSTHGYSVKLASGELARPVGAAVAMLRHGECPDDDCEDGMLLVTGEPCRLCVERGKNYKADHANARRAKQNAAAAEKQQALCPVCGRDCGTSGAVCEPCADVFDRVTTDAADQAAADSDTLPGSSADHGRELVMKRVRLAREQAARDGASDLGQLMAGQMAAESTAREIHQQRMATLAAPQDQKPEIPAQAPAPVPSARETAPCTGTRWDGKPCKSSTVADDGLCGVCRALQRDQQEELAGTH